MCAAMMHTRVNILRRSAMFLRSVFVYVYEFVRIAPTELCCSSSWVRAEGDEDEIHLRVILMIP